MKSSATLFRQQRPRRWPQQSRSYGDEFRAIGIIISWSMQWWHKRHPKGRWKLNTSIKWSANMQRHDDQTRWTPIIFIQLAVHFAAPPFTRWLKFSPPFWWHLHQHHLVFDKNLAHYRSWNFDSDGIEFAIIWTLSPSLVIFLLLCFFLQNNFNQLLKLMILGNTNKNE